MSTITVDVRDFEPTGPIPPVSITRARIVIDASADKIVSTAAAEMIYPNDAGTNTFELTAGVLYLLTITGLTGIRSPLYVTGPQVAKSLAALYRQDRVDPMTLQPLPSYPSIAAALASMEAQLVGIPTAASVQAKVDAAVAGLVSGAPGALDTLKELADALGDDANFAATISAAIATKLTQTQVDARVVAGTAPAGRTGVYADLTGKPTLGTAAAQPVSAFDAAGAAAAVAASVATTYVTFDGAVLKLAGNAIPIGQGLSATDNGLGSIDTTSSAASDNGLGGIAA